MAAEGSAAENLTTIGQVAAGIVVGVFWIAAWWKRFFAGRKEAPPVPSMAIEQAFSMPTDSLHGQMERCADFLEAILARVDTMISEQARAREAEKAAAIQQRLDAADQDRANIAKMIEGIKRDMDRRDRRSAKDPHP